MRVEGMSMRDERWSDAAAAAGVRGDFTVSVGQGTEAASYQIGRDVAGETSDEGNAPSDGWLGLTEQQWREVTLERIGVERRSKVASSGLQLTDVDMITGEIADLIWGRHAKYGATNLANTPGGALNGIVVRLYDKLARLAHSKEDFYDESLRDTLLDIAGYGVLGLLCVDGLWPGVPSR